MAPAASSPPLRSGPADQALASFVCLLSCLRKANERDAEGPDGAQTHQGVTAY